jgi:hypothetical protein
MIRREEGSGTMKITTVGLDLTKSVFQVHGVDEGGRTVLVKKLHRKQMLARHADQGSRPRISIRASGRDRRTNRPDT